jgi:uncharacterized protein YggT (Ycf19 family)
MFFALASLVVVLDVLLAWVQEDPKQWPRRATHWMTEPALRPLRRFNRWLPIGDLDLSPVLLVAMLTATKVFFS